MLNFKVAVGFLLIAIAIALQVAGAHAVGYYSYSNYLQEGYYGGVYSAPIYSNFYPAYNVYNPVQFQPILPSNSNFYFAGTYTNPRSNFDWYAYIDTSIDYRYVPSRVYNFFCGFSFC